MQSSGAQGSNSCKRRANNIKQQQQQQLRACSSTLLRSTGEPNYLDVGCLLATALGWNNHYCNAKHSFICEKVPVSDIEVDLTELIVEVGDIENISCEAKGYPSPDVTWSFNGVEVSTSSTKKVIQTKGQEIATLNMRNATILDEGVYTCSASNVIGNITHKLQNKTRILVPSKPTINYIQHHSCNASLSISWSPHFYAVGIDHSNNEEKFTYDSAPRNNEWALDHIQGLSGSTFYSVWVYPCSTTGNCTQRSIAKDAAVTGGLPREVTEISLAFLGVSNCTLSWNLSNSTNFDTVTGYQITVDGIFLTSGSTLNFKLTTGSMGSPKSRIEYIFQGRPNIKYKFGIKARTCAGLGPVAMTPGYCITEKQAPAIVPRPLINSKTNSSGKAFIEVISPNQENGELSCIFVIVKPETMQNTSNQISEMEDLIQANSSLLKNSTDEYIAVSLEVPSLKEANTTIVLGTGNTTFCNVSHLSKRYRRWTQVIEEMIFVGKNEKLHPRNKYQIYTVSCTPFRDKILLKASELQSLPSEEITDKPDTSRSTPIIIILATSLVLAGVLLIIGLLWKKRQNQLKDKIVGRQNQDEPVGDNLQESDGYGIVQNILASEAENQHSNSPAYYEEIEVKNLLQIHLGQEKTITVCTSQSTITR